MDWDRASDEERIGFCLSLSAENDRLREELREALRCQQRDSREVERLRALTRRWNVAASRAGFAGSEYIDNPELVFRRVEKDREFQHRLRVRLAALTLGEE